MLMKAEALIRIGGSANWTEALSIINQIRERSELNPRSEVSADNISEATEEMLLEMLLDERDMEFAAGIRITKRHYINMPEMVQNRQSVCLQIL